MRKIIKFSAISFAIAVFTAIFFSVAVYATGNIYLTETHVLVGPYDLEGILLIPETDGSPPPVVIMIHGTGQTNKDSSIGEIAPFRDIAHGLAESGIASIRYNKRFYQHPPIPVDMTLETEIFEDVSYAIEYAYNHTDLGDIFLVGFSLGGILAPTIAHRHNHDSQHIQHNQHSQGSQHIQCNQHNQIAGIISLAGSPRHASEILVSQSDMLNNMYAQALGVIVPSGFPSGEIINWVLTATENEVGESVFLTRMAHQLGFPFSYLHSLRDINTHDIIDDLHIPMLFMHGSEDLQVFVQYDFLAWYHLVGHRDNVTFMLYEGLNHFFTPHVPELGYWQTQAPANVYHRVIKDMADWINYMVQLCG